MKRHITMAVTKMYASSHVRLQQWKEMLERKWNCTNWFVHSRQFMCVLSIIFPNIYVKLDKQTRWHSGMKHFKMIYLLEVHTTIQINNDARIPIKSGSFSKRMCACVCQRKEAEIIQAVLCVTSWFLCLQSYFYSVCFDWFFLFRCVALHCIPFIECDMRQRALALLQYLLLTSADIRTTYK